MAHRQKLTNIGSLCTWDSGQNKMVTYTDYEILIGNGKILEMGSSIKTKGIIYDCCGRLVTPGFVDSHTHPVFYKGREDEFEMRRSGVSYEEISQEGGGINSSIHGVRTTHINDLRKIVSKRMDRFLSLGTTTVEAKSGYGLNVESELKCLELLAEINESHRIDIVPTFMGAHSFPPEFAQDHDAYIDLICNIMIPAVHEQNIAKYNDVFCENGYFTREQSRRILQTGKDHGLVPRLHADEFQDSGGAELACELGAASVDHLMAISEKGIQALKNSNVIATLLPGTTFFLGSHHYAPVERLIKSDIEIGLASDFNPGSSHIQSMAFIMTLGSIYLKMPIDLCLKATTFTPAKSLNLDKHIGSIEPGKQADLILWDLTNIIEIPYYVSHQPIINVLKNGKWAS